MSALYTLENEVFRCFAFYSCVILAKMVLMSPWTGFARISSKSFANPEDAANFKTKVKSDDNVERVRRAHLNDIENIIPFFCLGLLYISTNPSPFVAKTCFRLFTAVRLGHTLSYLNKIVSARGLFFVVGIAINFFMISQILIGAK